MKGEDIKPGEPKAIIVMTADQKKLLDALDQTMRSAVEKGMSMIEVLGVLEFLHSGPINTIAVSMVAKLAADNKKRIQVAQPGLRVRRNENNRRP